MTLARVSPRLAGVPMRVRKVYMARHVRDAGQTTSSYEKQNRLTDALPHSFLEY